MFGATAVRQKRERERREKLARGSEPLIYPYIRPFGPRFQPEEEIPYLKYRKALEECGKDLTEPLLGAEKDKEKRPSGGPLPGLQIRQIEIPGQNGRQRKEFPAGDYDSGGANVILYIGLGMVAMGLVITFVGLGDKGFRTLELKLIGPSLVGCGMFFALLRVLFCTLPSCCKSCMKCCGKAEETEKLLKDVKDKGKPEVRMEAGRVAGRPPGQQARPPGHAVHASSVHDPGDRRSSLGLAASIPGRSDWKAYERRNFEVDPRTHVHSEGPRAPHYVSDSEEEVNHQFSGSLKHERQTKNQRHGREIEEGIKPLDSISNSSSSTFSVNELDDGLPPAPPGNRNFTGSTVNLRTGEIILNATKLQVNEQNK